MTPARNRTPYVQLTRLFLRQFLENDLISPDADRLQLLAVAGAVVMSLTLFICTFMSFTYVGASLTPGQTAILSLDNKFFYLALAMLATGLIAASQWDVLAIDPRDAAILEPLPIDGGTIRRAKVSAVAILGGCAAIAVNLFPSVIFPWLLVFGFRQLSFAGLLQLIVTHAVVTVAAAAFGYFVVIAVRETIAAILGPRWFPRVSPWVQGILIVMLGSSLLLLPPASEGIGRGGFDGWRAASPPMWFLGAYEVAAGGIIADLPRTVMSPRQFNRDQINSKLYSERRRQFPALARQAGIAFAAAFALAAVAYLWNARRPPSIALAAPAALRRRWRLGGRLANALLARHAATRAGFYFTLAAMWRSNTHRLTLACAAAAGFAMVVVTLSNANVQQGGGPTSRLLLMQPLLYGALLIGFRHVIRVPAELRANWGFQLAWYGRDRAFLAGVRHAAIVGLVLPALAVLFPLYAFVMGPQAALLHAAMGLAGAVVFLEALTVTYDKVPFTCNYVPSDKMKALGPIGAIAFLIGAFQFAAMQNRALHGSLTALVVTLAILFAVFRLTSIMRDRPKDVDFDEVPASFAQMGLHIY